MMTRNREIAIQKIIEMPVERASKVLIFMAGMEAEHQIDKNEKGALIFLFIGIKKFFLCIKKFFCHKKKILLRFWR